MRRALLMVLALGSLAQYKNCNGEPTLLAKRKDKCGARPDMVWMESFNSWGDLKVASCIPRGTPILFGEKP